MPWPTNSCDAVGCACPRLEQGSLSREVCDANMRRCVFWKRLVLRQAGVRHSNFDHFDRRGGHISHCVRFR